MGLCEPGASCHARAKPGCLGLAMLPFKYGGKEGTGQCALPVCRRLCGIPCVHAQTSKEDVPSAKVISPHSGGHCECKDIIIASYPQRRMPHVHVETAAHETRTPPAATRATGSGPQNCHIRSYAQPRSATRQQHESTGQLGIRIYACRESPQGCSDRDN
jgi:hypothetical protein